MRRMLSALVVLGCAALPIAGMAQQAPAPPEGERLIPGQRDGWLADARSGCWVWTGGMRPTASNLEVRWSGACPEGPAAGPGRAITSWREGDKLREMVFEGNLVRGKAEGRGTLAHLENGEAIVLEAGEYANDYLTQGRVEVLAAGIVYEGALRRGTPHGEGRITGQGREFSGTWQNGCLQVKGGNWVAFGRPAESCRTDPT